MKLTLISLTIVLMTPAMAQALPGNDWLGTPEVGPANVAKDRAGRVQVEAMPSHLRAAPGQQIHVALRVTIKDGWSWYSPRPGETPGTKPGQGPIPGGVEIDAKGLEVEEVLWPPHQPHETLGEMHNSYLGTVIVFASLTVPADAKPGEPRSVTLRITGQICGEDQCAMVPPLPVTVSFPVAAESQANMEWSEPLERALLQAKPAEQLLQAGPSLGKHPGGWMADLGMLGGLGLSLLAGLILNIMPCVLPVIPLKVLSIAQQAKESRRRFVELGLSFALGIVLFFVAIAILNAILKTALQGAFQWGEHFQIPAFRIGMAILMVALAVNLFGGFTVLAPRHAAQAHGRLEEVEGVLSAVGMGMLTAVLSTPCSFAILTAAIVWAQAQSLAMGSFAIILIGVGMAAPYAALTAMPDLVRRLPRPGVWMEHFKQSMGFVLLLVAVWLVSTFARGEPGEGEAQAAYPFWLMAFAVVLAFCLWMWGSWVRYDASLYKKTAIRTVAACIAVGAGFWMLMPPQPLATRFERYDQQKIEQALKEGRVVLIDFTAAWCVNCKAVEKRVYDDPEVAQRLKELNVLAVKGDTTTKDLPATAALQAYGDAIPVTVIRGPGNHEPIRLRGIFSKEDLFQALEMSARK